MGWKDRTTGNWVLGVQGGEFLSLVCLSVMEAAG